MSSFTDVIIIGAGAAGLAAAKEVAGHDVGFSLVEASQRIGGRACSEEIASGVWFDPGCGYLHQGETSRFAEVAAARGLEIGREQGDVFDQRRMFLYQNGVVLTAWATEPRTRRSCSAALPGQAHQREKLAQPVHNRLLFTGEASSAGDYACCHGACRSGVRAVREIAVVLQ